MARYALTMGILLLGSGFCVAQYEPEVFTAARAFNKALSSNPPDVAEAASILVGYNKPHDWILLQSKWITCLTEKTPGTLDEKRKKLVELFDAFDGSFGDGDAAKQPSRTFIKLRDELLGRTPKETETEQSAALLVQRLRNLPGVQHNALRQFGRFARDTINAQN